MHSDCVTSRREDRFASIAAEVAPAVLRYALRRTDHQTAEDVLSETLLVVWRRLDDVPAGGELPWCYAVARNQLANAQRSARRQRGLVTRIARLDRPPTVTTYESPDPEVHAALAKLRADEREVLRLWAWEDLTPAQIAEVLGTTSNAVSIRLHRARRKFADLLAAERKDNDAAGQERVEEGGNR